MNPRGASFLLFLLLFALGAGASDSTPATHSYLISATRLAWYPAWVLRLMFWYADVPGEVPLVTGTTLYRVAYRTHDPSGAAIDVSGLVAVPHEPLRGVVIYFHGTNTERSSAPSAPSLEGRLIGAGFAGGGYLLLAPDYIGLGNSMALHPYLHVGSAVNATVDLLHAAQEFCQDQGIDWSERVNLVGFSQGGHATLAVQRHLEAHPEPGVVVTAAAAMDGSYDLAGIGFPVALAGAAPSHPVYLAYLVNAYTAIYHQPIQSLLKEPYTSRVPNLFDGTHGNEEVVAALPRNPRDMFTTEFLALFDGGGKNWFLGALEQNEVHRWAPRAPARLYYGNLDLDVSPREAVEAANDMRARGGDAEAISVGDYDHGQAVYHAFAPIRAWFDELNPTH